MRRIGNDWRITRLTEHFTLGEMVVSRDHPEYLLSIKPTWEQANSLYILCSIALQPIRNEYGAVVITSGLVSEELNSARGGVQDSQHLYGEAVDFVVPDRSMLDVFAFCKHNLRWEGELILYKKRGHIHLSLPSLFVKPNHIIKEV